MASPPLWLRFMSDSGSASELSLVGEDMLDVVVIEVRSNESGDGTGCSGGSVLLNALQRIYDVAVERETAVDRTMDGMAVRFV